MILVLSIILALVFSTLSEAYVPLLVKNTSIPGRYNRIFLPFDSALFVDDYFLKQRVVVTPKYPLRSYARGFDLCFDFAQMLPQELPDYFNGSISNPCERYFCSAPSATSSPWLNATDYMFSKINWLNDFPLFRHYHLQQYCTLCANTATENFPAVLNAQICPNFNRDYCPGQCGNDTICISFSEKPICFLNDTRGGQFVFLEDAVHMNMVHLRTYLLPIIIMIGHACLVIANIFLVIIPELYYIFTGMENHTGVREKLLRVFGLKNWLTLHAFALSCVTFILGFAEITTITHENLALASLYICILWSTYCFSVLIILWWDIVRRSDKFDTKEGLGPPQLTVFIFVTVLAVFILIIAGIAGPLESSVRSFYVHFLQFSCLIFCLTWSFFTSIALIFVASSIYLRIRGESSQGGSGVSLFTLKFTRSMLFFNIINLPVIVIFLLLSIQSLVPGSMSMYFLLINWNLGAVMIILIMSLFVQIMFQAEMFKNAYTCHKCREKGGEKERRDPIPQHTPPLSPKRLNPVVELEQI